MIKQFFFLQSILVLIFFSIQSYGQSGLYGLYNFEDTGNIIRDASCNGNNGSVKGTYLTQGKIGYGRQFSGSDFIEIPAFNPRGSFTIEAWVKLEPPLRSDQMYPIVDHGVYDFVPKRGYLLTFTVDQNNMTSILFAANESSNQSGNDVFWANTSEANPPRFLRNINQFYHIAAVWDGTYASIYVNGELWYSEMAKPNKMIASNSFPTLIGAMYAPDGKKYFKGIIDEVRITQSALSARDFLLVR